MTFAISRLFMFFISKELMFSKAAAVAMSKAELLEEVAGSLNRGLAIHDAKLSHLADRNLRLAP